MHQVVAQTDGGGLLETGRDGLVQPVGRDEHLDVGGHAPLLAEGDALDRVMDPGQGPDMLEPGRKVFGRLVVDFEADDAEFAMRE